MPNCVPVILSAMSDMSVEPSHNPQPDSVCANTAAGAPTEAGDSALPAGSAAATAGGAVPVDDQGGLVDGQGGLAPLTPAFPEVPADAWPQLQAWAAYLREWNEKINLVSRKDIDRLESKHLAHCLVVTRVLKLMHGARVIDVGTGGGFPGLPMAICYPQAQFLLVDSVGKKLKAVEDIADRLGLKNVEVRHARAETLKREFDFITGRAVSNLPQFVSWVRQLGRRGAKNSLENGLLYWKGGEYEEEIRQLRLTPRNVWPISDFLPGEEFEGKYLLHFLAQDLPATRRFTQELA